ncbi:MAG: type II toxin-antitoxin system RelE/ParE family toxin, partial [Magnetococcales bacterium]|nr:type II toxin-antitoxin system RelE/ParE family toxin [Magnetococcales bacterium]
MIKTFKHKGLKRLFRNDDTSGVQSHLVEKLQRILTRLEYAEELEDMNLLGYRLHQLHGDLKGVYTVTVNANWRVTFRFSNGNATDVDLIDY